MSRYNIGRTNLLLVTLFVVLALVVFGIFMLSGCGKNESPQAVLPDKTPPYIERASPYDGAKEIAADTEISLHILDDDSGVDRSSIRMKVNGKEIIPVISGNKTDYLIKYRQINGFQYGQQVSVTVEAQDLALKPNRMEFSFAFSIENDSRYPPVIDTNDNLRMNLIYYGKHTVEIDSRILSVRPQYLIGNPAHGLWGEAFGYDTWWLLQDVTQFQQAGIKVIGYLTSGYEGRGSGSGIELKWYTLEMNRNIIQNMAEQDGVDGIFIDECSNYPDAQSREYLKELTGLAHGYGLIVWGNVGHDDFDGWFFTEGGFDLMHASENWQGQSLTPVQQEWGHRISVTGFHPGYTAEDAYRLTKDAWDKGLAYAYISNDEYAGLPSWIEELSERLRTPNGY